MTLSSTTPIAGRSRATLPGVLWLCVGCWLGWIVVHGQAATVVVGCKGCGSSGTVYLFDAATGSFERKLTSPDPQGNGCSSCTDFRTPGASTIFEKQCIGPAEGGGVVPCYDLNEDGGCNPDMTLCVQKGVTGFGKAVAVDGQVVIAGANYWPGKNTYGTGYVFSAADGSFTDKVEHSLTQKTAYECFTTHSAALAGNLLVVGCRNPDGQGQAFWFDASNAFALLRVFFKSGIVLKGQIWGRCSNERHPGRCW